MRANLISYCLENREKERETQSQKRQVSSQSSLEGLQSQIYSDTVCYETTFGSWHLFDLRGEKISVNSRPMLGNPLLHA